VTEISGELRHLRLEGVADDERGGASEQCHGDDNTIAGNLARGRDNAGAAAK